VRGGGSGHGGPRQRRVVGGRGTSVEHTTKDTYPPPHGAERGRDSSSEDL
jgi:hypothetical protein